MLDGSFAQVMFREGGVRRTAYCLAYQRSLMTDADTAEDALLSAEALTVLVNGRMAREGMAGRCSLGDLRAAIDAATSDLISHASRLPSGAITIEHR